MHTKISRIIQSVMIAGLLFAFFAGAVRPARASPWTPLDWQNGGKLRGWVRDTNDNFVDDLIDQITAANPNQRLEVIVDFNRCLKEGLGAQAFIESLGGQLMYQAKFVTYAIYSNIRADDAAAIAARPEVAMVELSVAGRWLDTERKAMKVQRSERYSPNTLEDAFDWPDTLNGNGVNIAILDTGVDDDDPDLAGRYRHGYNALTHNYENPPDDVGHGTGVALVALGSGNFGIAPEAGLVDIKVGGENGLTGPAFAEALDVVLLKREDWNIKAVNLSLGLGRPSDGQDALSQHVNRLVAYGIVVVATAGNGPDEDNPEILPPGAAAWAITVGAADPGGTVTRADDVIAISTNGPRADDGDSDWLDELKPEVASSSCCGTSPAAARTSGLSALLLQSEPDINPGSLKDLLIRTAEDRDGADTAHNYPDKDAPTWDAAWGFGYTDAFQAAAALNGNLQELPRTDLTFIGFADEPHPGDPHWRSAAIETESQRRRENPAVGVADRIYVRIINSGPNPAYMVPINFGVYDYTAAVRQFYDVGTVMVEEILPGEAREVSLDWTPAPLENGEHGCVLVTINYGLDTNYGGRSNVAQRNLQIKPTASPVTFTFHVENPLMEPALIHLKVVGTPGWTWALSDNDFVLHPWEDCPRQVTLTVTPPNYAQPGDQGTFDVYALATTQHVFQDLIGGVTAQAYVPCYDLVGLPGVGMEDIQAVASRWRLTGPGYDALFDINRDGTINIVDIAHVAAQFGATCSGQRTITLTPIADAYILSARPAPITAPPRRSTPAARAALPLAVPSSALT